MIHGDNALHAEPPAWPGRPGLLARTLDAICPVDAAAARAAAARAADLAIPAGSLGRMLALSVRLAAIQRTPAPAFPRKVVVVMAGDHGVVRRGVSAFPPEVTPQMVANFARGRAAINALAGSAGARVVVTDVGVAAHLTAAVGLRPVATVAEALASGGVLHRKVRLGTDDLSSGPAMTREQATAAMEAGIDVVEGLVVEGLDLVATGDMGIGNTTPSSALACVFTGHAPRDVTGRGTGIDDPALERKRQVVEESLAVNRPDAADPLGTLAAVGGLEIAGIAGVILGAAAAGIPVLVDGFISTAGALVACALAPAARDYLIAAHRSLEPGHRVMLEYLGVEPLLDLDLRLGEGTGAALAMPLVDGAAALIGTMATFAEAGVSESAAAPAARAAAAAPAAEAESVA
ncbi:MAG: nicotinate-nucleotide--dimethylbenzimidazole phosphoribosyltransferase [Thermoleophilia bacterium]